MSESFESKLKRYAEVAVRVGVNLQPGQRLMLRAPVEAAPMVRQVVAAAYQAGARLVDVIWNDDQVTLSRFRHAPRDSFDEFPTWQSDGLIKNAEKGEAFLTIYAEDPDLLKEQDQDLVALAKRTAQTHLRPYYQLLDQNRFNWCAISVPIESWATKVFPDEDTPGAMTRLWDEIFRVVRVDEEDPVAAWQAHVDDLQAREKVLNEHRYRALHYQGPGTDLTIGLPENHLWVSGLITSQAGVAFTANMPTEEVFTLPHRDRVDGTVQASLPLSYSGVLIEEFGFRFEKGEVKDVWAKAGEATLQNLLATDDGARRLGEVALVPQSSPVSRSGRMFFNTLFDENAACHLALGKAYPFCLEGGEQLPREEYAGLGINDSLTHVDFMIGSDELDIDGVTAEGDRRPILRKGEWAF